jgi:long-chain acyl-CoA synthetase
VESFRARSAATQLPAPPARRKDSERLVWIDWLKVLVVFGVFVYHVAQPFVVVPWVVSNDERSTALSALAGFAYLFGMPLMFLLAGATAWLSLGRRSLRAYGAVRVRRLLVPLVVGIAVLTPLQWWLAAAIAHGGEDPLNTIRWFYGGMRFEPTSRWFGDYGMHLWFIAFLLAYSILCLPLLGFLRRSFAARALDRLATLSTPVLLLALLMPILIGQLLLRIPTPAYGDWADFALWLGFFALGVVLIAETRVLDRVVRSGPRLAALGMALVVAAAAGIGITWTTGIIPFGQAGDLMLLETGPVLDLPSLGYITWRTAAGAALVGASLWIGVRWFTWQPPGLQWASRAILPFYVLHHPVAVAVAAMVVPWSLGIWPKFAIIGIVTLAGTMALTVLSMHTRAGRALFGIPSPARRPRTGSSPMPAPADPFAIHSGEPLRPERIADGPSNMVDALRAAVRRYPDQEALRWKEGGRWMGMTYAELWSRVRRVSLGLEQRGMAAGDRIVIVSRSRPEWVIADYASLALGAVVCPIYPGESDARIELIARGLRPRLMFVEHQRQLSRIGEIAPTVLLPSAPDASPRAGTLDDVERDGQVAERELGDAWDERVDRLQRSHIATIVQTIDEEGVARGAVLTHGNVLHNLDAIRDALPLRRGDVVLSILPLSHMMERGGGVLVPLATGATVAFAEPRVDRLIENMREVRPHAMLVVPLFLTHLAKGMRGASVDQPGPVGGVARWSLATGAAARGHAGVASSRHSWLRLALADLLVLRRLRAVTGGRLRYVCCGGAPLPVEVGESLSAVGIPVLEGYGMTECSPGLTMNRLGSQRFGTVGPPIPGTELRIDAESGEVLARGPQVMRGYHDLRRQTAATMLSDGWLRTGDLGEWDACGNLRILGVRKDLLVLATGKKVSPRPLEAELEASDLIARAALVNLGDEGVGILVWPNAAHLATRSALDGATPEEMLGAEVRRLLTGRASYERPRRLGILPRDLSVEGGEIAADGRPNRAVIVANWRSIATAPISWRTREVAQAAVLPSPLGAVSSAG